MSDARSIVANRCNHFWRSTPEMIPDFGTNGISDDCFLAERRVALQLACFDVKIPPFRPRKD
jgi:hypothetical protein